jgi:uracil-DNA glycosylase
LTWHAEGPPLIIGQAPARGNDGLRPFAGQSGARLARLAGVGESGDDLPRHFGLVNLLSHWPGKSSKKGDKFDMAQAKINAEDILLGLSNRKPSYLLLMGRKVQTAFDLKGLEYLHRYRIHRQGFDRHCIVPFPHPSGINTWWNDPENVVLAEKLMRKVLHG